jgi:hypothetical protein
MMSQRRCAHSTTLLAIMCVASLGLWACSFESTDPVGLDTPAFAKGGKGGGGADGSDPEVTAAEPDSLPRGAVGVALQIVGAGFTTGSSVSFELDGVETDLVSASEVTYISETLLVATVDVSSDAQQLQYDVAVANGPKKKGVGIDLLKVVPEFVVPVLEATPVVGDFYDPNVYAAANGLVVGRDGGGGGCGSAWVYEVESGQRTCVSDPRFERLVLTDVNTSARIVGYGPLITTEGESETVPILMSWPDPTITILPSPSGGWTRVRPFGVNEWGEIVGQAMRNVEVRIRNRTYTELRYAIVRWDRDGNVAAVTQETAGLSGGPGTDISDDGLVGAWYDGVSAVWDGQDGSTPTPLDSGAFNVQRARIRADGTLLGWGVGNGKNWVLEWSDPYGAPALFTGITAAVYGSGDATDESGNVFVLPSTPGPSNPICIGPTGSYAELALLEGAVGGYAIDGTQGLVFGASEVDDPNADPGSHLTNNILVSWDVSGGC